MPIYFAIGLIVVLLAVGLPIFGIWALPGVGIVAIVLIGYLLAARGGDNQAATIERGRRTEPTGTPRKSTSGAETANERVGQS
jgi:hypothetical protein